MCEDQEVISGYIEHQDSQAWEELAVLVRGRRAAMGLTQLEASERAGLGINFWNTLEQAKISRMRRMNAGKVEAFLRWAPGSIEVFLMDGVEPEIIDVPVAPASEMDELRREVEDLRDQVELMLKQQEFVGDLLKAMEAVLRKKR